MRNRFPTALENQTANVKTLYDSMETRPDSTKNTIFLRGYLECSNWLERRSQVLYAWPVFVQAACRWPGFDGRLPNNQGRGFKTGSNLVFKGWKKKTAQVIHVVIDDIMHRLRDGRNLPSSWEEYKLVKGSAGALCFTCWANVCKTKGYGVWTMYDLLISISFFFYPKAYLATYLSDHRWGNH